MEYRSSISKVAIEDAHDGQGAYRTISGGLRLTLLIPASRFANQLVIEVERQKLDRLQLTNKRLWKRDLKALPVLKSVYDPPDSLLR